MTYPLRLLVRALVTWAIEAGALVVLAIVLPGLALARWDTGALAIAAIALLNALLRPLILLVAVNLLLAGQFDIAVRDVVMSVSALTLGRVLELAGHQPVFASGAERHRAERHRIVA